MKKTLLTALLLCSFHAMAQDAPKPDSEMCTLQAELAEEVMTDRQNGLTKQEIKTKASQISGDAKDPDFVRFLGDLFKYQDQAFEIPVAKSEYDKFFAIRHFKEKAYSDCIK